MTIAQNVAPRLAHIPRFDHVQRVAHWVTAALFGTLMFTAIPLYFGSFFGVVFPRHLIEMIHLWCGVALPIPIIFAVLGPWGRGMRRDLRRVNAWTRQEIRWALSRGRTPLDADKFNPGQKLNTIFIGCSILVMLVTGSMLQWFRFFSVPLRQGATFVHDVFAFAIFAVVIGHIYMAITHRDALRSIFTGWVSEQWAKTHAPRWLKEYLETDGATDSP